ncbi:MAG: hypothetical protein EPN97_08665 [Alphaproteobacteria bacterium]|nr:MAG: hypothetical protein EPN97_08665 [Alphaproteobacteria bacterium]
MTVNLIDPSEISHFLRLQAEGDAELAGWLELALSKSLRRRERSASEILDLPPDAPEWLRRKWNDGGPFHCFRPDAELADHVRHVRDWLVAARAENAPFLKRVNAQGQPLKLLNLDLAAACHAADKYFERLNRLAPGAEADDGHAATVMNFAGGYRIVQMLTPEALRVEGRKMGTCVGTQGGRLLSGEATFYSLRDGRNEPHATLARLKTNVLSECKGRHNRPVLAKYLPPIMSFLREMKISLQRYSRDLNNLLQDTSGELHILTSLPSTFAWRDSLEIRDNDDLGHLPLDLTVQGNFMLHGCHHLKDMGHWLTVAGNLEVRGCPRLHALARDTKIGGSLMLDDCGIERLSHNLSIRDSLIISRCPRLIEIPPPLQVDHSLVLRHCPGLSKLPEGLMAGRDLEITRCPHLLRLPDNFRVGGRIVTDLGVFTNADSARAAFAATFGARRQSF